MAQIDQSAPADKPQPMPNEQGQQQAPSMEFAPGELAPFWASPNPNVLDQLSDEAQAMLKELCDLIGNKDVAARRWEVEQTWESRLFDRGYHYLLPRRGGGWVLPPFATNYNSGGRGKSGTKNYGQETNIYTTYGEIITAALTRDVPEGRFEPKNPESDADITAADAGSKYLRCFLHDNDLLEHLHQLCYYLRNDGRALIITNHVLDAQRYGRMDPSAPEDVVPETEAQADQAIAYLVRHGETDRNAAGVMRGQSEDADAQPNERGQQQSVDASQYLSGKGIGRVISSPVGRARDSAAQVAGVTGLPVEIDDRFAARDVGDLEGQPSREAGQQLAENAEAPGEPLPGGGESQDDLDARVRDGLFEALNAGGPPPAIVTHDSAIASAFRTFYGDGIPPADIVPPGGVVGIFPVPGGGFTIKPVYPTMSERGMAPEAKGDPRGIETIEIGGKLEYKCPINCQSDAEMPWKQYSKEVDVAYAKAMFPDKADDIKSGSAGAGENELDRIARINACLALEASYVTGDSMVRDCTIQRTWMRPSFFMEIKDKKVRAEFFEQFPDGLLCVYAGEAAVLARNENMDDHCTTIVAGPGSGMNRMSLMEKVKTLQKRLNNWVDLLNEFFIRTVPMRVVDVDIYDMESLQNQSATPGDFLGIKWQQSAGSGRPLSDSIFVEPTPTHQPSLPDFITWFANDLPQLLSGALPSLFGSESNNDATNASSGVALGIQRDQALARLGTPWHNIQLGLCNVYKQAVQLAAQCRTEPIRTPGEPGEAVRIELTDLKGNVLVFPADDPDVPESWNQRQARYAGMIAEAATNPAIAAVLSNPVNAKMAHDAAGMEDFIIPQAVAWDKQMGELAILLKTGPVPNPAKAQLEQQIQQAGDAARAGAQVDPQMALQMAAQLQAMPDLVSTVPVDPQCDDSVTEAACCLNVINGPEGRRLKNGTPQEREAFQNLRLHFLEHEAIAKQNQPGVPPKPISISANIKDMPPDAAAAALNERGLHTTPQSVAMTQENNKPKPPVGGL